MAFALAGALVGGGSFFSGVLGIGLSVGLSLLSALLSPKPKPTQQGKLSDLTIQSSDYGADIVHVWGKIVAPGRFIDSGQKLNETKHKIEAGKGFLAASPTGYYYTYSFDGAFIFCSNEVKAFLRVWADTKVIRDVREGSLEQQLASRSKVKGGGSLRFYNGTEDQLPDPLLEKLHGVGKVPAYRGQAYMVADKYQLANTGNHIPNFSSEVMTAGDETTGVIASYFESPAYSWYMASFGFVGDDGEVYAYMNAFSNPYWADSQAKLFHFLPSRPDDPVVEPKIELGITHPVWTSAGAIRLRSDEPSYALGVSAPVFGFAVAYYSVANASETLITAASLGAGHTFPSLVVKYGEEIYVINGGGFLYFGPDPAFLMRFNTGGGKLSESNILFTEGGGAEVRDARRSPNYFWALFGNKLIKLDHETLELVETIDLSMISNPLAFDAVGDDDVHIFSADASGSKFWHIENGVPVLKATAPSEGYAGIRGFHVFGLHYVNGLYVVDFAGYIGGFAARIDFFAPLPEADCVPLSKVVRDRCKMGRLIESQINAAELTDCVDGYAQSQRADGKTVIAPLQGAFYFDGVEYDGKINFLKRGRASSATILQDDMAAHDPSEEEPEAITVTEQNERTLPARVEITYLQRDKDYEQGNQYDERLITDSGNTVTEGYPISMGNDKARQVAQVLMKQKWTGAKQVEFAVSRKYIRLVPTDTVEVEL